MRKLLLLCVIALTLTGCAAFKQASVDARACLSDPVCLEMAQAKANSAKSQATAIAGVSPIPLSSNAVGGAAYGIALLIALVRGGRKKRDGA